MSKYRLQFLVVLATFSFFYSCSDLNKGKYLSEITTMNNSLDSLEKVLQDNQIDTLAGMMTAALTMELRVKNNYESDTIDMELGKKMDAFKRARKRLKPIGTTYSTIRVGINEEREMLKKLEADISQGNGDRKKYGEYVTFEKSKVDKLQKLLSAYLTEKESALENFNALYPELNAFSLELLEKKKNKRK